MQPHNISEFTRKNYKQPKVTTNISYRFHKDAKKMYLSIGIALAMLLGHVSFRHPATSDNLKLRTAYHEFSHTAAHTAAIDNESTLATYADEL